MRRSEWMLPQSLQHRADRAIDRNWIAGGLHRPEVKFSVGIGPETRSQIHRIVIWQLQIVQAGRRRLPYVEKCVRDGFAVEGAHGAVDREWCAFDVARDIRAKLHLGRAVAIERSEQARFGSWPRFSAVGHLIDDRA